MKRILSVLALALCFVLAACGGGGGGGGGGSSTPTPTPDQIANAQGARLAAGYDVSTGVATLTWNDTFPGATYLIEQQDASGNWTQIGSVMSQGGVSLSWTQAFTAATTLRVAVQESGYVVPLETSKQATSIQISTTTALPTITIDQPQPITTGGFNAAISGGGNYLSATYYFDTFLIYTSVTNGPDFTIVVESHLTPGSHLLLARLATGATSYVEVQLTIQVATPPPPPPPPEVTVTNVAATAIGQPIIVDVSSSFAITSVSATLNGQSLGTPQNTAPGVYQFTWNPAITGCGPFTVNVQATDANGVSASSPGWVLTFSGPPVVTLNSPPFDGYLVGGTLQVSGVATSPKPCTNISIVATLGDLPVLQTPLQPSGSTFSGSFNINGISPGFYTLHIVATDDSSTRAAGYLDRSILVTSANLAYPVLLRPYSMTAVAGSYFVYSSATVPEILHTPSGSDVTLTTSDFYSVYSRYILTDTGYTFVQAALTATGPSHIYMWSPTGVRTDLSVAAGTSGDVLESVHYPWVLWATQNQTSLVLYNVSSGQQFTVPAPAATSVSGADFCDVSGQLTAFYNLSPSAVVMRWDQATNTSVQVASSSSITPQTDGIRVAWINSGSLTTLNLATNTTQVLSTSASNVSLSSGLLGWVDESGGTEVIKASDGTNTTTVTTIPAPAAGVPPTYFDASSGGYLIYEQADAVYAWSLAGGPQVIFAPFQRPSGDPPGPVTPGGAVMPGGKTIYFDIIDNGQVLYSTTLP